MQNPFEQIANNDSEITVPSKTNTQVIDSFRGENEYLSNFYTQQFQAPIEFLNDNGEIETVVDTFMDVEHAFQASKTLDRDVQKVIRDAGSARKAKKLGRKAKLREDWEEIKVDVMRKFVFAKFTQHPDLKMRLLFTKDAFLVEGNNYKDVFWGVTQDGVGKNHLGKILMQVRQYFVDEGTTFESAFNSFLTEHKLDFLSPFIKWENDSEQKTTSQY